VAVGGAGGTIVLEGVAVADGVGVSVGVAVSVEGTDVDDAEGLGVAVPVGVGVTGVPVVVGAGKAGVCDGLEDAVPVADGGGVRAALRTVHASTVCGSVSLVDSCTCTWTLPAWLESAPP